MLAIALGVAAVVKELRVPPDQRTWHGALGGFIPYDFRMPTLDRIKSSLWNPGGPVFVGRPFGVGWTINFGGLITRIRSFVASRA